MGCSSDEAIFGTVVPKATFIVAYNPVSSLLIDNYSYTLSNVTDRNFKT